MNRTDLSLVVCTSDRDHVGFVHGLNDPDAGVLVVQARPDTRRFGWVARDMLAAMGVSQDVTGKGRSDADDVALLPVWLLAHDIRHLIVFGVEVLPGPAVSQLIQLAAGCGIHLWLLGDHAIPELVARAAASWPGQYVDQEEFDRRWRTATMSDPAVEAAPFWPDHVPDSDFPTFVADVRRLLPAPQAQTVEARFRETATDTAAKLAAGRDLDEDAVFALLRSALSGCVERSEAVTVTRGFQAAAFCAGWFVKVDIFQLFASGVVDCQAVAAQPETWRRFRAYRQPYRAVTAALYCSDVTPDRQANIQLRHVAVDGSQVMVDRRPVKIPAGAEVFLTALRLERIFDGAAAGDLLFVNSNGGPVSRRQLPQAIRDAGVELGIALAATQVDRKQVTARQWRNRLGVSVEHLGVEVTG